MIPDQVPPVELMSDAEQAFYVRVRAAVVSVMEEEIRVAGIGPRSASTAAMAALGAVAQGVWVSLPPRARRASILEDRMVRLAEVASRNIASEEAA